MRGQRRLQGVRVIIKHACHLREAQSERAQGDDLGGAGHFACTIGPPSGGGTARGYQAVLLVEPQRLCGDAEPPGGCGRVQKGGGGAHESPRCWLPLLYPRSPRGRVKRMLTASGYRAGFELPNGGG